MFGIPSDTFVGRVEDFYGYVHPEDRKTVAKAVSDARQSRKPYAAEFRVVRLDGTVRWVSGTGQFYYDSNGDAERMLGLAADITERKRVDEALRDSEERFRLAAQAGKMYAYEWDVATDRVVRSEEYVDVFGSSEHAKQPSRQQLVARVHPDDRALFVGSVDQLTPENSTTHISYRVLRPDGSVVWLEKSGRGFFDEQGKLVRTIGMVVDITERKRAEEAKRESEDRLQLLLDSTAEAIYGIDLEGRCTFCNPACLRALGYERVDELLGKNMHDLIHHTRSDGSLFPVEECRIFRAFRAGEGVHVDDEVLWRANRTSFPAEYWSYPQRRGQKVVGAVVAFVDITERKLAEAALANVTRRLIEAQEQERTRIARELHDDFAQRLSLLAVGLEELHQEPNLPEIHSRMGELQKQTHEIATDIQALSHELHSAKLQYLGIGAAMRGFCQEFGEHTKVKIEFKSHDLPGPLSPDISLCLFRVLQEALHNSTKHSGARHVEVQLWGTSDEIHLTVSDSGAGFDREAAKGTQGLGLISMEERLKLVKGTFSIESRPRLGTTIHARVPLSSGPDSMRETG
jgi:PAS domain S-box-containing protein